VRLRLVTHVAAATSVLLASFLMVAVRAVAEPVCDVTDLSQCAANKGGIETGLTKSVLNRAKKGRDIKTGAPDKRSFEYTSVYACPTSTPGGSDADILCEGALQACAANTAQQGRGPMVRLYRREIDARGAATTGWQTLGTTCLADLAPGKRILGLGHILTAFHNTPWAKPAVHIQPEGNVTLVTLPTYFAVTWPAAGFQPGEADTVILLGRRVRIRPTLEHYSYVFGDGTSSGPTSSPGGPYPRGDITHAYPKAGTYNSRIAITYGGEFSVNGGAWITIPDTVTVAGPLQPVTVKTARARLVIR
jgi:hypothetical protein